MAALADRARLIEVAHNLLSLEVNTILKENMTGERMPPLPHALLDVAGEYARALLRDGVRLGLYFPPAIGNRKPEEVEFAWGADTFSTELLTVSLETFDSLLRGLEMLDAPPLLVAEARLRPLHDPMKMNGCALLLINAPKGLEPVLGEVCGWVAGALGEPGGEARVWRL